MNRSGSQTGSLRLWYRWILANALSELIGLGAAAVLAIAAAQLLGEREDLAIHVISVLVMISGGVLEGAVVGYAQWYVLRQPFVDIERRSWVLATMAGAILAWTIGVIPSLVMAATSEAGGQVEEPGVAAVLLMAALMGIAAGAVLSLFQWFVLRRYAKGAGIWIPANSVAWMLGLPVVFIGATIPSADTPLPIIIILALVSVTAAGAIVGAVHGLALIRLSLRKK